MRLSFSLFHSAAIVVGWSLLPAPLMAQRTLEPTVEHTGDGVQIGYRVGKQDLAKPTAECPAGLEIQFPDEPWRAVKFDDADETDDGWKLGPAEIGPVRVTLELRRLGPNLIERLAIVSRRDEEENEEPIKFRSRFSVSPVGEGTYASWMNDLAEAAVFNTLGGGPEYGNIRGETFPVALWWDKKNSRVLGVLADSPAMWENRCVVEIDPAAKRIAVSTGDGRDEHELKIVHDAAGGYRCTMDGWQTLDESRFRLPDGTLEREKRQSQGPGSARQAEPTKRFTSWLFVDRAKSRYDTRLAAHLALANAKGWNDSALEAILRNTAYLLLRRNLMRDESRYIFISGIGYGWKQWGTDAFYLAVALGEPKMLEEAYRGLFESRLTYEDNSQYYLILSALVKRAGGNLNEPLMRRAYEFIRENEKGGLFIPPPLPNSSKPKGFKTYMDLLEYDDGDCPTSNQGFHCGALLAAKELGLGATDDDIDRAVAGFQSLFNERRGFFPTSKMQPDILGQDTLYGAAMTYAVFGRKVATDDQVKRHLRHTFRVMPAHGMRVISNADGSLLDGHGGAYVWGGSWFMCDHANLQLGQIHGMKAEEMDRRLVERIMAEVKHYPAFNESINTVTGRPHGHILYSSHSGYAWMRPEIRKRLGLDGPDAVAAAVDKRLGVVNDKMANEKGWLRLSGTMGEERK